MSTPTSNDAMSLEALIEDVKAYILENSPSRLVAIRGIGCQLRRTMRAVKDLDSMTPEEARKIARLVREWYPDRRRAATERMLRRPSPQ